MSASREWALGGMEAGAPRWGAWRGSPHFAQSPLPLPAPPQKPGQALTVITKPRRGTHPGCCPGGLASPPPLFSNFQSCSHLLTPKCSPTLLPPAQNPPSRLPSTSRRGQTPRWAQRQLLPPTTGLLPTLPSWFLATNKPAMQRWGGTPSTRTPLWVRCPLASAAPGRSQPQQHPHIVCESWHPQLGGHRFMTSRLPPSWRVTAPLLHLITLCRAAPDSPRGTGSPAQVLVGTGSKARPTELPLPPGPTTAVDWPLLEGPTPPCPQAPPGGLLGLGWCKASLLGWPPRPQGYML